MSETDTEILIQNEQEISENAKNNNAGDIKDDVDELDLDETYNIWCDSFCYLHLNYMHSAPKIEK